MAKADDDDRTKGLKLSVPLTAAQVVAVRKQARKAALTPASWARMILLRETDWNPDEDEDLSS